VQVGTERRFLEDRLIHRTERNDLVRSKSEVIIADKLHARGIRYAYEQKLVLEDGAVYYPDFTVVDDDAGVTFYWEHLGMLDDPQYASRWERKLARYRRNGILPHDEGGGPRGSLIVTRDDQGALDSAAIGKLIDTAILGR
jgi:predicted nuclease of restriction endonuclease-like RecB superfamily